MAVDVSPPRNSSGCTGQWLSQNFLYLTKPSTSSNTSNRRRVPSRSWLPLTSILRHFGKSSISCKASSVKHISPSRNSVSRFVSTLQDLLIRYSLCCSDSTSLQLMDILMLLYVPVRCKIYVTHYQLHR